MLKGLRHDAITGHRFNKCLTGFPDVEGIETSTMMPSRTVLFGLTGFPDVEGIETDPRIAGDLRIASDRLP